MIAANLLRCVLPLALLACANGCGGQAENERANAEAAQKAAATTPDSGSNAPPPDTTGKAKPASEAPAAAPAEKPPTPPEDNEVRVPATAMEAGKVIDLTTVPLFGLKPDEKAGGRSLAQLMFQTKGEASEVYGFYKKYLTERGWKEPSDGRSAEGYASGEFMKDGFLLSVSASKSGDKGDLLVSLTNQGNVNLRMLPVPEGAKLWHAFPAIASFLTDAGVDETAAALKAKLLADGWRPYGHTAGTYTYQKNAVELHATVNKPATEPGKTSISFTASLMSVELPAPPDATRVDYADTNKQLYVETAATEEELLRFYKMALAEKGWKPTTDKPITDTATRMMIFRNVEKDMLTLTLRANEEKRDATLVHQSAAEVKAIDDEIKRLAEARKKKEEEAKNRPKPSVEIAVPADASEVEATANEIQFEVAIGKAKAAVDKLVASLEKAGWKAETLTGNSKTAGMVSLAKDDTSMSISWIDPGMVVAGRVMISGRGVELKRSGP